MNGQNVGANLGDYDPEGDRTGSFKITGIDISASGAGVSWDDSHPDSSRYDFTTNTPAVGDWIYNVNAGALTDPVEIEAGSIVDCHDPDSTDIVANYDLVVEFDSCCNSMTYDQTWTLVP